MVEAIRIRVVAADREKASAEAEAFIIRWDVGLKLALALRTCRTS